MDTRNENCGLPYDWCYYPHRSQDALSPICGIFPTLSVVYCSVLSKHFKRDNFTQCTVQLNSQLFSLSKMHIIEPLKSCPEATTCLY